MCFCKKMERGKKWIKSKQKRRQRKNKLLQGRNKCFCEGIEAEINLRKLEKWLHFIFIFCNKVFGLKSRKHHCLNFGKFNGIQRIGGGGNSMEKLDPGRSHFTKELHPGFSSWSGCTRRSPMLKNFLADSVQKKMFSNRSASRISDPELRWFRCIFGASDYRGCQK